MEDKNIFFMEKALEEAHKAYEINEVPIGAVIVKDGEIIASAHNEKEIQQNSLRHAEITAIEEASKKLGTWRLQGCEMYVTVEPCAMCAGAIIQARLDKVYIGAMDPVMGACGSKLNLLNDYNLNYRVDFECGLLDNEARDLMQEFFKKLRNK